MSKKKAKKKGLKTIYTFLKWGFIAGIILGVYAGYILFAPNFSIQQEDKVYLHIPDNSTYDSILIELEKKTPVISIGTFKQVAFLLQYQEHIRPGRYEIKEGMSNFSLIRTLRSGKQTPVNLTFNNVRTKEQLAGKLGRQLMADSAQIIKLLNDTAFLSTYQLTPHTSISLFIPNTYEVFWNINAQKLFDRMNKEYTTFWTDERKAKAAAIPLTQSEVSILAAIVEEETNNKKDKPMVAGLYINRLKMGMPLQADPTVKYAVGDFSLKRILRGHLLINSPYNTYKIKGLPPGPIRIATPAGIDAVLNYAHHNYIYMCASDSFNGEHNFAITWQEHLKNAKRYREALNLRNIK